MSDAYLNGLNEHQRKAVTAPLENALVLAGAGSGKTKVLVSRMAWLVEKQGISPHALLAVTFTNKAAGEMKSRLSNLLTSPIQGLWVGTFHGLCHRLLRKHFVDAKLPEQFHILDSDDQGRVIKRVISALNLDVEQWPVKQAQAFINARKDEGLRSNHINPQQYGSSRTLVQIYQAYEQACQTAGVIDFAEILLRAHELLRDNHSLLHHYQQRFKAILVDEFQDTNTTQYAWIRLLAGEQAFVMAVGDDDQSIYGWRGAKVENIKRFSRDFANTQVIRLEQNYRSTATILNAANALIAHNSSRMGKNLWTEGAAGEKIAVFSAFNELEEARFVSDEILSEIRRGRSLDDIAILYRSNAQSRVLEEALLRAGIAYRIHGGVRFFERAEIKDALSYLRLLTNPNDDTAFERVVNFPTRGIGEKTLDDVRLLAKTNQSSLWLAAKQTVDLGQLPQRASVALSAFLTLIERLQLETKPMDLDDIIRHTVTTSGLYAYFEKLKGDKAESKLENLQELASAGRQFRYEQTDDVELSLLAAFLAHASLEAGDIHEDAQKATVHMMTLHAAKGLEFPQVFMVGLEEGLFPGHQSIADPARLEEERRLCYVGMTRAMQKLTISYAEIRRQYGREERHRPSRFLSELPINLINDVRAQSRVQAPISIKSTASMTAEQSGFRVGQSVTHAKFGKGVVLSIEGSGAHTRVQVKFVEGSKWLVVAYANLLVSS